MTYNRDLQEDKERLFDTADTVRACVRLMAAMLRHTSVNAGVCAAAASDSALLATDFADYLVRKGMPFRHAHHAVGAAVALAEKYLGRIPRGSNAAPDVVTLEMKQSAEKRMNAEVDANPQVDVLWHTVPFAHKDSYALEILAQILSDRTGRLYKGLVLGSGVATDAHAAQTSQKWAGYFNITGEVADGHTPAEVEAAIYAELDTVKHTEVPAEELQKVKNQFAAVEYRKLESNMGILINLLQNDGNGDWQEFDNATKKIQAVTAADVQRVAKTYFTKENRAVATYTRKAAKEEKQ